MSHFPNKLEWHKHIRNYEEWFHADKAALCLPRVSNQAVEIRYLHPISQDSHLEHHNEFPRLSQEPNYRIILKSKE